MPEKPLQQQLRAALGGRWQLRALGVSSFCETWEARHGSHRLFVKSASGAEGAMLRAEADGLRALAATGTIRVPEVMHLGGETGTTLALEWLDFRPADSGFGARFGGALAALHARKADFFGWNRDNFVGATPQVNTPTPGASTEDWVSFFGNCRLRAMRDRLPQRGAEDLRDAVEEVIDSLAAFFEDGPNPRCALIHGDLWQGNWGMLADGTPVIFDPAVSCSDPEAELAMMELFGAPPGGFEAAYQAAGGVRPHPRRQRLYQLYHLLNHAVLFGGGYLGQALSCARSLALARG